jgi:hypothetical protein
MTALFADTLVTADAAQHYAVGWGTLTLVNAGLAQGKGRSGLLWWVASLFFGPIATFLIVILPPAGPVGGSFAAGHESRVG